MNARIAKILDIVINFLLLSTAVIIPLLFLNLTSEFYETPKFVALVAITGLILILWSIKCLTLGKITLTSTPLDLPLVLLLIVFAVSTFFASSKPVAIFGNLPRIHGGLATFIGYVVFYFVLTATLKKGRLTQGFIHLLLLSGTVLSVLSLFSFLGKSLIPFVWASYLNFTPTGSTFSTTAILAMLLPFPLITILKSNLALNIKNINNLKSKEALHVGMTMLLVTLFGITIALTGTLATFVASLTVVMLASFSVPQALIKKNLPLLIIPILVITLVALATYTPIGGSKNILYSNSQKVARELQLPFNISWKTSVSAFRDSPIWGTGPASYLFSFTTYKPAEFNNLKFWTIRFDQPFNEYFYFLATLGALGLTALLLLTVATVSLSLKALADPENNTTVALGISGIVFFIILALHTSSLPVWIIGLMLLAVFAINHKETAKLVTFGVAATEISTKKLQLRFDGIPAIAAILTLILVGISFYFTGKSTLADYNHRLALNSVEKGQIADAYKSLVLAERLNPYVDLYRTDLAQTNFALAEALASSKGPSESSPNGSLTDKDKQDIQTFLSQAITEGRVATTLSPNNPANWEVLGSIYRQISGVAQNALTFSLDSYGKAVQLDPLNPNLRLTIGGIYYSVKNYDLAIRFFTDAINLKPDFPNSYYNLVIALRDKGDTKTAQAVAEKLVSLVEPNSPDFQKATDLLAELTSKDSTSPAQLDLGNTKTSSPSALQSKKLPKVLDLAKPDKVSTPPAVKK